VNIFEVKVWDDECSLCTFYSVQRDGVSENETDRFFLKYENSQGHERAVQELLSFILIGIGEEQGAVKELFNRFENEVVGLPVKGKIYLGGFNYHYPGFPLRLYALSITDNIVILFNGGIKNGPTNQTSDLHLRWREACQFANKIIEAIRTGEMIVDEENRKLLNHLGEDEIML
jgi:hypothetical protein